MNDEIVSSHALDILAERVDSIKFDEEKLKGQVIDESKLEWYSTRFDSFIEDGVPDAINSYLYKLNTEDINDITKIAIMHAALSKQLK